jgi:type IV pilus assembly protein PilW
LLAPVLILPGQTTPSVSGQSADALIVMTGSGVRGDAPMPTTAEATGSSLPVLSAVGVNAGDILLMVNERLGGRPCMVTQVNDSYASDTKPIDLTGAAYTQNNIDSTPLASYGSSSWVVNLGAQPQIMLFGVGPNNTLFSYDLLQLTDGPQAVEVADGVFELKALYGISTDTDNDGKFDTMEWVAPTDTRFNLAAMAKDPSLMGRITAIRIGLILRTSLPEKTAVTSGPLTLFSGLSNAANLSLSYSRSLSTAEKVYRYRTLEVTVPVRNNLL